MKTRLPKSHVLNEYVQSAKCLAEQNDGLLPNVRWLRINGHANLDQYMHAHPSAFSHIPQSKGRPPSLGYDVQIRARHRQTARLLAQENGGKVPSLSRLIEMGYPRLSRYIYGHPEFFKRFRREKGKKNKTAKEHIRNAEKLARKHGKLPSSGIILKEHGWALYVFMRRNSALFAHIRRKGHTRVRNENKARCT